MKYINICSQFMLHKLSIVISNNSNLIFDEKLLVRKHQLNHRKKYFIFFNIFIRIFFKIIVISLATHLSLLSQKLAN